VFRAVVEAETRQENIQGWLQLDEGDSGLQLDRGRNRYSDIFLFNFVTATMLLNFPFALSTPPPSNPLH
jgi:hypothetical protein